MRNALGVIMAAAGAFLVALAFSQTAALIAAGLLLLAGSLLLVIDWTGA